MAVHVVWYKRDLRVHDHAPLAAAAEAGAVLPLYMVEPGYWALPEHSPDQYAFLAEGLRSLDDELQQLGSRLVIRTGEAVRILAKLHEEVGIAGLWSHEETGLRWTWDRDKAVARWCVQHGIAWTELQEHGVVRRLRSRDGWARQFNRQMRAPLTRTPQALPPVGASSDPIPSPHELGLPEPHQETGLTGSRADGMSTLSSFLQDRGVSYRSDMSSPLYGWDHCSRLAPFLSTGVISLREVWHAQESRKAALKRRMEAGDPDLDPRWVKSLTSFESRLAWRAHFIQKFETEPSIEFQCVHRGYTGLREEDPNQWTDHRRACFDAWSEGQTGVPMVDACMRSLKATGWLNFRMRAMLVSFASYHLWLHWKQTAQVLAPLFLDFEAGIHYSQCQMQAGTTGINTIRIYNPVKQATDQDPDGDFIRRWVPELAALSTEHLAAPWRAPLATTLAGITLGKDYPLPVVDPPKAGWAAKQKMQRWRYRRGMMEEAQRVHQKHGSRRSRSQRPWGRRR